MGYYRLAPDLVVEVNSASDRASDVLAKAVMWLDAGVRLVWVADPPTGTVTVYTPDSVARLLRDDQILDGGEVLPDFRVSLADLFA
jgi:Uma2 family endonuclease